MTEILFARVDDVDASAALAAQAAAEAAQAAAEAAAASLTSEALQDTIGAMVSGNTETRIEVTYQDSDGTLDFVVEPNLSNYINDVPFLTESEADSAYQPLDDNLTDLASPSTIGPEVAPEAGDMILIESGGEYRRVDWADVPGVAEEAGTFLALLDTPDDYTGHGGKIVSVTESEEGLEFIEGSFSADAISFTPAGSVAATDVQAAIEELDSELDERIADVAGAMVTGNTETLITVTYQDSDNTIDFVVNSDLSLYNNATSGFLTQTTADALFLTPAEGNAAYQPLDSDLTAIAALTTTAYGRSLLTLADDDALAAEINEFYQPLDSDLTSWADVTRASGFDTFAATPSLANLGSLLTDEASGLITFMTTPSSANLRSLLTDESGTGVAYFQGGDAGTPSAIVLTNASGLTTAGVAAATLVVAADTIASNDNDTTWPTTAAIIDYAQPLDADLTSWAGVTRASGFDTFVATPTLANLGSLLTDEASGVITFLTTPSLANWGAMITDEASGLVTFMTTPSVANLRSLLTDDTAGATILTLTDPGEDRVVMWDEDTNTVVTGTLTNIAQDADPGTNKPNVLALSAGDVLQWVDWDDLPAGVGGGDVSVSGTPVDNQLAVWTDASTIEGDADLTFDTSTNTLAVGGAITVGGSNLTALYQPLDADLTTLSTAFTTASASGAASLAFHEDTDNGTNRVLLQGPASTADVTLTLQATTGTIYSTGGTDVAIADGGTGQSTASAAFDALSELTCTAAGKSILNFVDPNADRVLVWDDSAGDMVGASLGTGLSISATPSLDLAADLVSLITNWTQASASGASSLLFHEDTDNGSNAVTLQGPASTADVTVTLPDSAGTLAMLSETFGRVAWRTIVAATAGAGTYTPTSGMKYVIVFLIGGGSGGGGADNTDTTAIAAAGGGGAGGVAVKVYTAAELGATASYSIGNDGVNGLNTGTDSSAGGDSTFDPAGSGVTLTAGGGGAADGISTGTQAQGVAAAAGSTTNEDFGLGREGHGGSAWSNDICFGGAGGDTWFDPGAITVYQTVGGFSSAGTDSWELIGEALGGTGGGGATCIDSTSGSAGGDGLPGGLMVIEFLEAV